MLECQSDIFNVTVDEFRRLEFGLKKEVLDQKLALFFLGCSISFRVVESIHFKEFISFLNEYHYPYKLPGRKSLGNILVEKVHQQVCTRRKKLLKGTSVVLLVDGWKNESTNQNLLVCCARNLNIDRTLLYSTDISMETETGENLAEIIGEAVAVARNKYECEVYAIVTDNDSKIVKGGRLTEAAPENVLNPDNEEDTEDRTSDLNIANRQLWQSTCSSHSGNLIFNQFVRRDKEFFDPVKSIISNYRNPKNQAILLREGGSKMKDISDTRWCYFRDSCKNIRDNLEALQKTSLLEDIRIDDQVLENIHSVTFEQELIH